MSKTLRVHLKAGERIIINGGAMRVDRKVTIDLLNEVSFLLEGHILGQERATTQLMGLYLVVQSMLTDPARIDQSREEFREAHEALNFSTRDRELLEGLARVERLVAVGKCFEALKLIRSLYRFEPK